MRSRCVLLMLLLSAPVQAQMKMSVQQLVSFIKSSIEMKTPDKEVARYLEKVKLTQSLDASTVEDLQGQGAGYKTVEAMRALIEQSKGLPKPPPPAVKPKVIEIPRPDSEEQARVLAEAREYALNYVHQLPNFICAEVIRRYYDPSRSDNWHLNDKVTAKLTYFEQKEDYKVIEINGRTTDMSLEKLGGAVSSGEFGTLMREVFERESNARFEWERWATLRGRRVHVFSYVVPQLFSKWHINYQRQQDIVPGYRGEIFVDKEFPSIVRITMEAENIPSSFPIRRAGIVLDFDYAKIGEQEHLLPMRYVMMMNEARVNIKNETEFRMYRRFSADTSITFDTPPPLTDDKTREQPPKQ